MGHDVEIACPVCGEPTVVSLADVQQARTVTCPAGHPMQWENAGSPGGVIRQAASDLSRTLRNLTG